MTLSSQDERWARMLPGLWKKTGPGGYVGPWFQYHDAVGFEWNTYKVGVRQLPTQLEGLRIVQLSDLHCQEHWQTAYDDLADRLQSDPPDLILITGDIVDYILRPEVCIPTARRLLKLLNAPLGVIGIFGNHDSGVDPDEFDDTPLRRIDGKRILLEHRGKTIELIAPPGPEREDYTPGFETKLPEKTLGVPRIILSHYPDHIRKLVAADPDLFLSGHTHGGQACLPGRIPLIRHDALPRHMWHGVHRYENSWLVVNRGLGFSTLPIRIFCPSEVIEIRLTADME